jgi:hypothetical protein
MTGCYPLRVGMHTSSKGMFVLIPKDQKGLHPDEMTIAEVLKPQGYQTACIGKWHLGDQPEFLPTRQGFDRYYMSQLSAVRSGKWKLWLALNPRLKTWMGRPTDACEAALYNLETDAAETANVIAQHPETVKRLMALAQKARADIGDYQVTGSGQRAYGWVENPKPLMLR